MLGQENLVSVRPRVPAGCVRNLVDKQVNGAILRRDAASEEKCRTIAPS